MTPPPDYLRPPIANGIDREQALIRRWWYECHDARGRLVWEYAIGGRYIDCVWFSNADCLREEEAGNAPSSQRSVEEANIVICEAKKNLNPELIGQAIVYRELANMANATVREVVVFAERSDPQMLAVANQLGLGVVIHPLPRL